MQTFLNAKVRVKPLLITDQPATRSETLARILSPGGELAVLTESSALIRHLNYLQMIEGKTRGNHYHKQRHETFYVIAGEIDLHLMDLASGERAQVILRPGDMAWIDPLVVHTFIPRSSGHALEFAPEPFDATDVYRQVIA